MGNFNDELNVIISKLEKHGKVKFVLGATKEQIIEFELQNDIVLPAKYKEWLLFSDGGEFFLPAGIQLYGVVNNPVIDVSDNDRPNENYIVIGALASGDPILYEKNSEKIYIYNHGLEKIENDEIFDDFFIFLNNIVELLE